MMIKLIIAFPHLAAEQERLRLCVEHSRARLCSIYAEKADWTKYEKTDGTLDESKFVSDFTNKCRKYEAEVEAAWDKYWAAHVSFRSVADDAMQVLQETAFALAMERVRRKCGTVAYMSDHVGLSPVFDKDSFVISAEFLYPELIAALESLQKLGSFTMRFETEYGATVPPDWWRPTADDDWELYSPDDYFLDSYMDEKIKNAETFVKQQSFALRETPASKTA